MTTKEGEITIEQRIGIKGLETTAPEYNAVGIAVPEELDYPGSEKKKKIPFLPWSDYSPKVWKTLGKEKALRLFHLAKNHPDNSYDRNWISRWQLNGAISELWQGDYYNLSCDIAQFETNENNYPGKNDTEYAKKCAKIFNREPDLYQYLRTVSRFITDHARKRTNEDSINHVAAFKKGEASLGWDDEKLASARLAYQELTETLCSLFLEIMDVIGGKIDNDRFENAGEIFQRSIIHNFWDPMTLDPLWTVRRFSGTVGGGISIDSKSSRKNYSPDASSVSFGEKKTNPYGEVDSDTFLSGLTKTPSCIPEEEVLRREDEAKIIQVINQLAEGTEREVILQVVINGTDPKNVADEYEINEKEVDSIIETFVTRFELEVAREKIQSPVNLEKHREQIAKRDDGLLDDRRNYKQPTWWSNVFENIGQYWRMYQEARDTLSEQDKQLLDAFFDNPTGRAVSTAERVAQVLGIGNDTVRARLKQALGELSSSKKNREEDTTEKIKETDRLNEKSPRWGYILAKVELFRRIFEDPENRGRLKESYLRYLDGFFKLVGNGVKDKNAILDELTREFSCDRTTLIRHIPEALKVLTGQKEPPCSKGKNTTLNIRVDLARKLAQACSDTNFLAGLTEREKTVKRLYFDAFLEGTRIDQGEIAKVLGINACSVSRTVSTLINKVTKNT